jgi:hypothetical protein
VQKLIGSILSKNAIMKMNTLLVVLLFGFCFVTNAQTKGKKPELPKVDIATFKAPQELSEFLKQNPTVQTVHWKNSRIIRVQLKNGKEEAYDLSTKERRDRFLAKYHAIPKAPPPPPKLAKPTT